MTNIIAEGKGTIVRQSIMREKVAPTQRLQKGESGSKIIKTPSNERTNMQLSVWKFGSTLRFAALISAMLLGAGCATNGRHVLLKEYGATAAPVAAQSLKGVTICIKPFDCATNLILPEPATKPEEPEQVTLVKFTSEETKTWAQELVALEKTKSPPKESLWEIGNLRNGFGMVMSHVYAVNDP